MKILFECQMNSRELEGLIIVGFFECKRGEEKRKHREGAGVSLEFDALTKKGVYFLDCPLRLGSRGITKEKVLPWTPSLTTLMVPLWASTAILQNVNPRPVM